jgi:hypothetical protein
MEFRLLTPALSSIEEEREKRLLFVHREGVFRLSWRPSAVN